MDNSISGINRLVAIAKVHDLIDAHLETLKESEDFTPDESRDTKLAISIKQSINDQAYFLLAWGQIEAQIRKAHDEADRLDKSRGLVKQRHGRLSFKKQLSGVFEKTSKDWEQVWDYYKLRNDIAHGNLKMEFLAFSGIVSDFFEIQSKLSHKHD